MPPIAPDRAQADQGRNEDWKDMRDVYAPQHLD
jgi:hypothetical protein